MDPLPSIHIYPSIVFHSCLLVVPKPSSAARCTLCEDHYCKHFREFSHKDRPRETPLANSCCQSFHPHGTSLPVSQFLTDSAVAEAAAALLVCHSSLQYHFMYAQCSGTLPCLPGIAWIIIAQSTLTLYLILYIFLFFKSYLQAF